MTILNVVEYPDDVLRRETDEVIDFDAQLSVLVQDMFQTMLHYHGVGLAAPQIGLSKRIIVAGYDGQMVSLINPEIVSRKGSVEDVKGCLSLPGIQVRVRRAETIEVKAKDLNGKDIGSSYQGFFARIIQHEVDHLFQTLITDKGSPIPG